MLLLTGSHPLQACLHLRAAEAERLGTVFLLICLLSCNNLVDDFQMFYFAKCRAQVSSSMGHCYSLTRTWTAQMIAGEGLVGAAADLKADKVMKRAVVRQPGLRCC